VPQPSLWGRENSLKEGKDCSYPVLYDFIVPLKKTWNNRTTISKLLIRLGHFYFATLGNYHVALTKWKTGLDYHLIML